MRARDFAALVVLGALWGATFLFIRVAAPVLGPFVLVAARFLLAGALVLGVATVVGGGLPPLHRRWRGYLVLGTANAALPSVLLAVATVQLTASLTAILNATGPVWAAIVAAVWLKDPLTGRKIFGLVLGMAGVGLLTGWSPIPVDAGFVVGVVFCTLAMLCYAIGVVYASASFREVPSLTMAVGQQLAAGTALIPFAIATWPDERPSLRIVLAVLALSFLSTALAYVIYFRLLRSVGPTKTSSVTFLIPVFGLLWGVLFLNEPIGPGIFVGLAVILLGVVMISEIRLVVPGRISGRRTRRGKEAIGNTRGGGRT